MGYKADLVKFPEYQHSLDLSARYIIRFSDVTTANSVKLAEQSLSTLSIWKSYSAYISARITSSVPLTTIRALENEVVQNLLFIS